MLYILFGCVTFSYKISFNLFYGCRLILQWKVLKDRLCVMYTHRYLSLSISLKMKIFVTVLCFDIKLIIFCFGMN